MKRKVSAILYVMICGILGGSIIAAGLIFLDQTYLEDDAVLACKRLLSTHPSHITIEQKRQCEQIINDQNEAVVDELWIDVQKYVDSKHERR